MTQETTQPFTSQAYAAFNDPLWLAAFAVVFLVFVLAGCRVFSKAGFHPLVGMLLFVPVVNAFVFLFLAFSPWPIERKLRELRGVQDSARRADWRLLKRAS